MQFFNCSFVHLWVHHINHFIHPKNSSMQTQQVHDPYTLSRPIIPLYKTILKARDIIKKTVKVWKPAPHSSKGVKSLMLVTRMRYLQWGTHNATQWLLHSFHMIAWSGRYQNPSKSEWNSDEMIKNKWRFGYIAWS